LVETSKWLDNKNEHKINNGSLWIKPTDALNSKFIGITTLHVLGSLSAQNMYSSNTNKIGIQCACWFYSQGIWYDAQSYDSKKTAL